MVRKLDLVRDVLYSSTVVWLVSNVLASNVSTSEIAENSIRPTHAVWNNSRSAQRSSEPRHIPLSPKSKFWLDRIARKLSPFFSMLSLWDEKCWTPGNDKGTCLTRVECLAKGGSAQGYCAGGFGVCCVFTYTCDTITALNGTYFVNPEFPHSSVAFETCRHSVRKFEGVCQLRLDFEIFELDRPNEEGECWADMFFIEGADINLPPLCGDLTGHHMYLPIGYDQQIDFITSLNSFSPYRRWKIRMTKIKCCSLNMAPGGCLQHLRGISGRFTSFNYIEGEESNINRLNYGVCVRKEKGFCAIQWNVCRYRRKRSTDENSTSDYLVTKERKNTTLLTIPTTNSTMKRNDGRGLQISTGYSGIKFAGIDLKSRPNYFGNNHNLRCGMSRDSNAAFPEVRRPRNITLLQLITCPSDWSYYKLDESWRPVPISSSKLHQPSPTFQVRDETNAGINHSENQQDFIVKRHYNKAGSPIKDHEATLAATSKGKVHGLSKPWKGNSEGLLKPIGVESPGHYKPWKGSLATTPQPPIVTVPVYKPVKLPKPTKFPYNSKPLRPGGKPPHTFGKPRPIKGTFIKPVKIKAKPKPKPLKGFGSAKNKYKVRPKPKPKPTKKPKRPKRPKKKIKTNSTSKCKGKRIAFPFPLPLLFPFGGGGGGGGGSGGGGGGGGGGGHDEGWGPKHPIISSVEPYLIRVVTDSEEDNGLSSLCMEWEQIPCDVWHHDSTIATYHEYPDYHDEF